MRIREQLVSPPERVLVVSGSEKATENITSLIEPMRFDDVKYAKNGNEARMILSSVEFDLIIINSPLEDDFGYDLAIDITKINDHAVIIMLVKNELAEELGEKLNSYGILIVAKPVSRQFFAQTMNIAAATFCKIKLIRNEADKLQTKINEIKIVDRAKLILMQYIGMPEKQAHKYIEKQAMDLRITKREVAENILKTYEQ